MAPRPPIFYVMIEIMRRIAVCLFIALTLSAAYKKPAKAPVTVQAGASQKERSLNQARATVEKLCALSCYS